MRLALFIGMFLVLGGLTIFVDVIFRIHLPFMRIMLGLTLIYLGVSILLRGLNVRQPWLFSDPHSVIFQNTTLRPTANSADSRELNVLFSQGIIDLTALSPQDHDITLKVNVVFGNAIVVFDPRVPIKVIATSAFAGCRMPNGESMIFGERIYASPGYDRAPAIVLTLATVFGGASFLHSDMSPAAPRCATGDCDMTASNQAHADR